MKKLYGSFAAKLIAVILLCCLVLVFLASASAAILVGKEGGYTGTYTTMRRNYIDSLGKQMLSQVGFAYVEGDLNELNKTDGRYFDPDAFWFEILDAEGRVVLSNYEGGKTLWEGRMGFTPHYNVTLQNSDSLGSVENSWDGYEEPVLTPVPTRDPASTEETETYWRVYNNRDRKHYVFSTREELDQWIQENTVTVKGYLPDPLPSSYFEAWELKILSTLYSMRYAFLWALGLSLLAGILVFIFLLRAAGHRKGIEEIVPSFVEKIPFDVFTVLIGLGVCVCFVPLTCGWDWPEMLAVLIPCVICMGLLFLLWCMSFAVRVKLGTVWTGTLVYKLCSFAWRGVRGLFRSLPLLGKWILGLAIAAFVDLIFRMNAIYSEYRAVFFWVLFWLLAGGATLYAVLAFKRLRKGAKEIAEGDLGAAVEEKYLVADLKEHAHDLNHIRDGLNDAVEQRLKSERFRTELITNVSHDIKTPLTSIVNYVDLLQKEQPVTEKQQEYLEVLSRQSGKLKKLIEDLIEASKASTGNLTVELQPCDLGVLLDQTAGEYGERLEQAGLELVLQKPEQPVTVMADGRHLWRVFDNLLNNIVKYALPGTRVYLSLREQNGQAEVTFRNISREPLKLSAGELTERFVQGDLSRHSDGNGLGLAIAMSLMRLQKGQMQIDLDGDLFKVTLAFPSVKGVL